MGLLARWTLKEERSVTVADTDCAFPGESEEEPCHYSQEEIDSALEHQRLEPAMCVQLHNEGRNWHIRVRG